MNLQIRDPRAHELAEELAKRRNTSLTEVVIEALQAELQRENKRIPLEKRLADIVDHLHAQGQPGGHDMTKDEIDAMWGHP